jgi:aspartate 4-decarboxylase
MDPTDLDHMSKLSPFELKNELVRRASSHSERLMLNAGRANPNFLATVPRQAFFELGLFAISEAERTARLIAEGVGGLPQPDGIIARFEKFVQDWRAAPGIKFLTAALSYARRRLAFSQADFLHEMVQGVLGCYYPEPVRVLPYAAEIVRHFLQKELAGAYPIGGAIDLFAVEGATAGITYVFNSLRQNRLLVPGDKIAIGMPIFTPYIEIPQLNDYELIEVAIDADPERGWQYPECELDKLLDPQIKAFLVVNPSNPASVKIDKAGASRIAHIIATKRRDLIVLTDDVYATFADDFVSLFATCPQNTILVYSFSKYFGATGWRLGVIAMHENNSLDAKISALPHADRVVLDERYGSRPCKNAAECCSDAILDPFKCWFRNDDLRNRPPPCLIFRYLPRRSGFHTASLIGGQSASTQIHRPDGGRQPERCTEPYRRAVNTPTGADGAVRTFCLDG